MILVVMAKKLTRTQKFIGPASLITIGLLFGLSGVMAKYLSEWLTAYQVVEYRFAIALIALLFISLIFKLKISLKGTSKRILALYAVTFPLSVILFTLSVFNGSVALAVFTFYTATLVSSFIIGRIWFKEKIHVYKQLALIAILISIIAFTDPFNNFGVNLGLIFGLFSGVIQGIASSFQKLLSNNANKTSLLLYQCLAGVTLSVIALLFAGEPTYTELGLMQWIVVILFGLAMLAITYLFLIGFKYTNLNTGSVLVSSELFFGPFFAYFLLSEGLSSGILIGGLFTIIAVIFSTLNDPTQGLKKKKKSR